VNRAVALQPVAHQAKAQAGRNADRLLRFEAERGLRDPKRIEFRCYNRDDQGKQQQGCDDAGRAGGRFATRCRPNVSRS